MDRFRLIPTLFTRSSLLPRYFNRAANTAREGTEDTASAESYAAPRGPDTRWRPGVDDNNPRGDGPWDPHFIDEVGMLECGGSIYDLNGDGLPDVVCGGDWRSDEV